MYQNPNSFVISPVSYHGTIQNTHAKKPLTLSQEDVDDAPTHHIQAVVIHDWA